MIDSRSSLRAGILSIAVVTVGLAVVEGMARIQRRSIDQRLDAEFAAAADGWRVALQREVDLFMQVLDSLRAWHILSDRFGTESIAEYEAGGLVLARSELEAFGLARRDSHTDGGDSFPVVFTDPPGLLPGSFDLGADPAQRARLMEAGRFAENRIGAPLHTADPLVLSPIHIMKFDPASQAWSAEWVGMAFAWLRPARLLQRALPPQVAGFVRAEWIPPGATSSQPTPLDEPSYSASLKIADQSWIFRTHAVAGYRASRRESTPGWIRVGGSALALMSGAIVFLASGRHERVRRLVAARTRELEQERAERARLEQELIEAGRLERQRVGQDLHDSLGQKLSGAAMMIRAALQLEPSAARVQIERVGDLLKDSVSQVRRIARGLAPVDLDNACLGEALKRLAAEIAELRGVPCYVEAEEGIRLIDAHRAMHVYQIAQEAVNNAARHAGATEIRITLNRRPGGLRLEVRDNGRGFADGFAAGDGMGLRLMRYRARLLEGQLAIEPGPDHVGTRIRLEV